MLTILALALFLAALVLVFGVRSWLHARRTGDHGWRDPGGRPGSLPWLTRVMTGAGALVAGAAAPVADLAGAGRVGVLDHTASRVVGLLLCVSSVVAVYRSQGAMGASWRIGVSDGERTALVTSGPFALVRNPVFSGMVAFSAGLALAVPNWVAVAGLALLLAGVELQVRRVEEPHLVEVHGEEYLAYAARTGRFVPGVGRLHPPGGRGPRASRAGRSAARSA